MFEQVVHPVPGAMAVIADVLDAAIVAELWQLSDSALLDQVAALHRVQCRLEALQCALVREVDRRGVAVAVGASSTAAWLRWRLNVYPGAAKRMVTTAAALHSDPSGSLVPIEDADGAAGDGEGACGSRVARGLAASRAALAEGAISAEHVGVIASALAALPPEVDPASVAAGEVFLAGRAREHDPGELAKLGRRLLHHLDPDCGDRLAEREQTLVEGRELFIAPRRGGGYAIKGCLDDELGAILLAALSPYAAPRPADDATGPDPRSPARRCADALADLLALAASHPHVATVHAARPTVVVTLDYATLTKQLGANAATSDWAGPVSAEAARRLACDAAIIAVVLGAHGQPLDVGRLSYTVTPAIRRALEARDRGCAFPGCDRPPGWTEAHHIIFWADGGLTRVDNMVLLCRFHHRAVHHDGWSVRIPPEAGIPEFVPPRWIDPTQTPRSKPWRAQLAALPTTPSTPPSRPSPPH